MASGETAVRTVLAHFDGQEHTATTDGTRSELPRANSDSRGTSASLEGDKMGKHPRLRCHWKNCTYKTPSRGEYESVQPICSRCHPMRFPTLLMLDHADITLPQSFSLHVWEHRKCPHKNCKWDEAKDEKERRRHIQVHHRLWGEANGFGSMGANCDKCGREFARSDYVARHKREAHDGQKRDRKAGG